MLDLSEQQEIMADGYPCIGLMTFLAFLAEAAPSLFDYLRGMILGFNL